MGNLKKFVDLSRTFGVRYGTHEFLKFFWTKWKRYYRSWLFSRQRKTGHVIANVLGHTMLLNPLDDGLSKDLFLDRIREPHETHIFRKLLKPGMRVLEIGANQGYYTLIEAERIGNKGYIYAFEPVRENYRYLLLNASRNDYWNVDIIKKAVGAKKGMTKINVCQKRNWSNIGSQNSGKKKDEVLYSESVAMVTVDDFFEFKKPPDVIRMDVEGYEFEIHKAMKKTLKRMKGGSVLYIEMHGSLFKQASTIRNLTEDLMKRGFQPLATIRISRQVLLHQDMDLPEIPKHKITRVDFDLSSFGAFTCGFFMVKK